MDNNVSITSITEKPQSLEKEKAPISLSTISYIQTGMSEGLHTDKYGVRLVDGVVITSNTAIKSFEQIMHAGDPFDFEQMQIRIGDLDFYYFDREIWNPEEPISYDTQMKESGKKYLDLIAFIRQRFDWLKAQRDNQGKITQVEEGGTLEHIPVTNFNEQLTHTPVSPQWYSGYLKIPEREQFEVEITDQMMYKHGENVYAMKFNTSGFLTFIDKEGRELKVLNMAQAAVQKFAYGNSHLAKAINAINLHVEYEGGDFYSLANTSHEVCPYIAKDYVLFLLENIKNGKLNYLGLEEYFGSKTLTAIEATYKMVDTMDSNVYIYHHYFNHVLPMVKNARKKLESKLDYVNLTSFGINIKYFGDLLLAIYTHEAGIEKFVPMFGHEGRASEKIENEAIASLLIGATKLEKLSEEDRLQLIGVRSIAEQKVEGSKGFTLVPMCYLEEDRKKLEAKLIKEGVEQDQAEKMIYFTSLMDIGNVLAVGNINKTMEILIEDAIAKKEYSSPFVKDQMSLYVGLFGNLRDFISAKINQDPANANFKEVFMPFFMDINDIREEDIVGDRDEYIRARLEEIINEKIEIWSYIGEHADNNMLPRMLKIITETTDPEARSLKIIELNASLSLLVARAQMDKYKDK